MTVITSAKVRRRAINMSPALKQNFGDHKYEDDGEMRTTVTPWLLKKDTDFQTKTVIRKEINRCRHTNVMSLIWRHVSTPEGPLEASSTKYKTVFVYNCIKF
jgi:hypothetical protein